MYESNPVTALINGIHPSHFPLPRNAFKPVGFRQTFTLSNEAHLRRFTVRYLCFILKGVPGSAGVSHVSLDAVGGGVSGDNGREATVNTGAPSRPARCPHLFKLGDIGEKTSLPATRGHFRRVF